MFGHDWESAEATIIAESLLTSWSRGTGDATVPHEYVADVRPEGEAPFRATFHEPLMHGHSEHPRPGEVVNVLFDPKSHNVKLAPEYTTSPRQVEHERAQSFKTIADAPPGTDSSPHPSREIGAARIVQPPASPGAG
jgi:hypothetical protein